MESRFLNFVKKLTTSKNPFKNLQIDLELKTIDSFSERKSSSLSGIKTSENKSNKKTAAPKEKKLPLLPCDAYEIYSGLSASFLIETGSYGEIYKGLFNNKKVAIKKINLNDNKKPFFQECVIMQCLTEWKAPNVVKYFGYFSQEDLFGIVMEYVSGGSLTNYIQRHPIINWNIAIQFTLDVLRALQFMHQNDIVHRDVKSDNILIAHHRAKLCDFGLSTFVEPNEKYPIAGSLSWLAPEIYFHDKSDRPIDLKKCDIYSAGMTMFEFVVRRQPFQHYQTREFPNIHTQHIREEIPSNTLCPKPFIHLMKRAWDPDPRKRPPAKEMVVDLATKFPSAKI